MSMLRGGALAAILIGLTLAAGRITNADTAAIPAATNAVPDVSATPAPSASTEVNSPTADLTPPSLSLNEQQPAPPEVKLSKGAAEIVHLAQSGVAEDVMLAYVATVASKFNLGSDQIIYLNDLGVSGAVVKAMIQRDSAIDATSAAATASLLAPQPQPPVPTYPPPAPTDLSNPLPPEVDTTIVTNPPDVDTSDTVTDDSDYFYNSLAPYGGWAFVTGVGLCWQPTVCLSNPDWRPYCDRGRWVYSDCGWYWQSDYSWGWAAFHYGRWFQDAHRGWVWEPNRVWSPAWVSWRHEVNYCGWAPLPPTAKFKPGVGFSFGGHAVAANFDFGLRGRQYTFIPTARMSDYTPARYALSGQEAQEIHSHSTVVNHFTVENHHVVNQTIDPREVSAASGTEIRQAQIHEVPRQDGHAPQPDRIAKHGESFVIYRSQLPAPAAHRVNGNGATTRSSAVQPRSEAPVPNMILNAKTAASPGVIMGQHPARENYPAGSLVVIGQHNSAPLPNMRLTHVDAPAAQEAPQVAVTPTAPGNYYAGTAAAEPVRSPAGFNFGRNNNYERPRGEVSAAPNGSQSSSVYVMPGHYTVGQQLNANVQHNLNEAGARYGNGQAAQTTPSVAPTAQATQPAYGGYQHEARGGSEPARVESRSEARPVVDARAEMAHSMQSAAVEHISQAAPAPAPAASSHSASSSSSSSSGSGRR
jgi:hypothetical protein